MGLCLPVRQTETLLFLLDFRGLARGLSSTFCTTLSPKSDRAALSFVVFPEPKLIQGKMKFTNTITSLS